MKKEIKVLILILIFLLVYIKFSNVQNELINSVNITFDIEDENNIKQTMVYTFFTPYFEDALEYEINAEIHDVKIREVKIKI